MKTPRPIVQMKSTTKPGGILLFECVPKSGDLSTVKSMQKGAKQGRGVCLCVSCQVGKLNIRSE